jgi:hypothetical protein
MINSQAPRLCHRSTIHAKQPWPLDTANLRVIQSRHGVAPLPPKIEEPDAPGAAHFQKLHRAVADRRQIPAPQLVELPLTNRPQSPTR